MLSIIIDSKQFWTIKDPHILPPLVYILLNSGLHYNDVFRHSVLFIEFESELKEMNSAYILWFKADCDFPKPPCASMSHVCTNTYWVFSLFFK